MNRKVVARIICIVLVVVMMLGIVLSGISSAFAVTQSEIDALKDKQKEIAAQREELSGQINGLQSELDTQISKKVALDEQNELARQEIELINEQIDLYDKLIEQKALELDEAVAKEEEQKESLRLRMRAMEENGENSYWAILFKATSIVDFLSKLEDINAILSYDKQLEEDYIAARENVEVVKAEYEKTQTEQEAKKAELEERKADLEKQIEAANQVIRDLESDINELRVEYEENAAEEERVRQEAEEKIAQYEKEQEEIRKQQQAAADAAAAAGSGSSGGGSSSGGSVVGNGTYIWPAPGFEGQISSPYGWRIHPIFNENKFHSGIDIPAYMGSNIVASASGTVILAQYSSGYGNYVIISHGNGDSTLYGHMSSMAVSAGQTVNQGDVIGYVGSTGYSTGAHLHFEIKIAGSLVDPDLYV